ncbi:MAG: EAL domain-containing protein [Saccharofermentans sp.]|nr:EAL domain-containing protein [Saccharofermentans sp.]
MRLAMTVVFSILLLALGVCLVMTRLSKKTSIKGYVTFLLIGMSIPVIGNLILIASSSSLISTIGCYIYFLGMDVAVFSLWHFIFAYCEMGEPKKSYKMPVYIAFTLDLVQYALNPFFKCSFATEEIIVEDRAYYRLVPYIGQTYHRIICYGLFIVVLIIILVKSIKASRAYAEKYWIIFFAMVVTGAVETYYIFSRQPIDASMIGFAMFGLLIYYFSYHYRPTKLLDSMLAGIASDMPDALFFFDKSGKCIWINEPARKLIGISGDNYEAVKDDLRFLFDDDIDFESSGWFKKVKLGTDDDAQYSYLAMRSVVDTRLKMSGNYLSVRDITEEQREMKREMYNATHDSLTGLYTKEYLYEQIAKKLEDDNMTDYMIGYIEISNFKVINDVFGSEFGHKVLIDITKRLKDYSSSKSIYGRLSDDAFGMLINKSHFDEKFLNDELSSFTVSDKNLDHHVLVHFGIYKINADDEIDVPLFFDSARLASTRIKDQYKECIVFYDDKIREEIIHDQLISNQLQDAIASKQIRPYLQPIVDPRGMLAGAEALVRWIHPDEGFMNPGSFIPLFERNGLITEVDKYMWRSACEILSNWKSRGIDAFISVNISPKDFSYMDVVSELKNLVEEFGINPIKLRIEITESAMMTDDVNVLKIIDELNKYGFIIEMDDFGSGFSSLNLLKNMNIDVLKIDMQFLRDSERNMKAGMIIKNIINMSEDLGIDTLTEGVETAKQFEKLFAMGCKLYQGYYFSKPVPIEDFEKQWF